MTKGEMTVRTVSEREVFLRDLARAGWDVEGWDEALDTGANVDPEAEATYAGPVFDLRLEFHAEGSYLAFAMMQRQGELALHLRLHPGGDVAPLLARIIAAQDNVDVENHAELVKLLIALCDPLLIETGEGLYRLSL